MPASPLDTIMNPGSISVTGASNNLWKMGSIQMLNLIHSGYTGDIMPVHPQEKEVLGKKAYSAIADLPYAPELAIMVVPTPLVPEMLEDYGRLGTRHAVIITAGFRETGDEGRKLEQKIITIARDYGMRFLGPNCLGIINSQLPLNITVGPLLKYGGSFSMASQSGTYIAQTVNYLFKNGIGFGKAISVGNEANIDLTDCLEYLGKDPHTRAIGLYIEGIRDAGRFLDVAREVSKDKPIIAQYVGGTDAGARAGSSHTGAMAGPDFIYEGMFEQAGIIRAATIEEVYKTGWALANQPGLKGKRIAVLTNSGGPGTAVASTCNAAGLEVPEFSPEIQQRIGSYLPGHASARNPVDLTFHIDMETLTFNIPDILFKAPDIHGVIIHGIMDTGFMGLLYPYLKEVLNISREDLLKLGEVDVSRLADMPEAHGKPLMISSFFGIEDHSITMFHDRAVPTFDSPEKAAKAMAALYSHFKVRSRDPEIYSSRKKFPVPAAAEKLIHEAGKGSVNEFSAKNILKSYGIPVAREILAVTMDEAIAAARELGFPVAVKACADDLAHKTEQNLVFLDIRTEAGIRKACRSIRKAHAQSGILVAEMLHGRRELMAGISTHPGFPPCVMFGLGGIFAEALKDFTIRLAPLTTGDALEMIETIRAREVLGRYRSMPAVDREALADILVKLGDLALHFPHIREVDLNPIIIVDTKPVVADALMILQ